MEIFTQFDVKGLDYFIEKVLAKHDLKSDPETIKEMIISELKEKATKMRGNATCVPLGFDDGILEKAIIKASSHVKAWKEKKKDSKKETPKNVTVGNNYFDKNGQKHTKAKKNEPKKSEKKGEFEKEDLTQLELFDFE